MSDTPKTDELIYIYMAKRDFVPDGLWIRHSRELERENAALRDALDNAIVLLRRWNKNDVTDDVVIETRKVICAVLKEVQP